MTSTTTPHTDLREKTASLDGSRTVELTKRLENERRRFTALEIDFQNLQADLVAKNREIGRLKAEITKREQSSTTMVEVRAVWDHYVATVPKQKGAVVFGDGRKKMIRDRLRECRESGIEDPVGRLKRAIDGLAARPYVKHGGGRTGEAKGAKRYALPSHCFASDERVEMAIGWLDDDPPTVTPIRRHRVPDPFERPVDKVLEALRRQDLTYKAAWGAGPHSVGKWMAQCPAHDDREASLSIREGDDGRALLNCFAGCEVTAVCDALSLSLSELFARAAS